MRALTATRDTTDLRTVELPRIEPEIDASTSAPVETRPEKKKAPDTKAKLAERIADALGGQEAFEASMRAILHQVVLALGPQVGIDIERATAVLEPLFLKIASYDDVRTLRVQLASTRYSRAELEAQLAQAKDPLFAKLRAKAPEIMGAIMQWGAARAEAAVDGRPLPEVERVEGPAARVSTLSYTREAHAAQLAKIFADPDMKPEKRSALEAAFGAYEAVANFQAHVYANMFSAEELEQLANELESPRMQRANVVEAEIAAITETHRQAALNRAMAILFERIDAHLDEPEEAALEAAVKETLQALGEAAGETKKVGLFRG
jgi:hypothetical protein